MQNINIVKIWSDSINEQNIRKLVKDIEIYQDKIDEKFLIISSWAVKLWKNKIIENWWSIENISNSSLASIWQQYLMQMYDKLSWEKIVWQILLDDYINTDYINIFIKKVNDKSILKQLAAKILWLVSEQKDLHLALTIADLIRNDVLTIINHNDATSNDELKNLSSKTDNDKNTIHITEVINRFTSQTKMRANRVIFLTNTNGLLDSNWETVIWWIVDIESNKDRELYLSHIEIKKSNNGTWWMSSKVNCAFDVLDKWASESIIANSKFWLDCLSDNNKSTSFRK